MDNSKADAVDERPEVVNTKDKIEALELKKLQQETSWLYFKFKDLFPVVIAVATLIATGVIAWKSGLLDVKRIELSAKSESLAAKGDRLAMDNLVASQEKEKIEKEAKLLADELTQLKSEVSKYAKSDDAFKSLSKNRNVFLTYEFFEAKHHMEIQKGIITRKISNDPDEYTDADRSNGKAPRHRLGDLAKICEDIGKMRLPAGLNLTLRDIVATEQELDGLSTADLRDLNFLNCSVSNQDLMFLRAMPQLNSLYIESDSLDGLGCLVQLSSLQHLSLSKSKLKDSEFEHGFAFADRIESLSLTDVLVTDAVIESLGKFSKLKSVSLYGTGVSIEGIKMLAKKPSISHITFTARRPDGISDNEFSKMEADLRSQIDELNKEFNGKISYGLSFIW